MTAYWKTTKDLHRPSEIRKKKRNSLDSSGGKGERVWRSSEWCQRAGQPGSNKMWSHQDAREKTRWGQKTHCLKEELQSARNSSSVREPQHPDPPQQQSTRVSSHSLSSIHSRYDKVLQTMKDNNCSMANASRLSGCPRSTLQDFIAIAELKKVDSRTFEIALANYQGETVRELEQMCRKSLRRYMPLMSTMRLEGQLLPLKFDQRFYEWSFTCNKKQLL